MILVSDASPLAGLPPGRHGHWEVHPSGKIVVAGTPYLAGSNQGIETGLDLLLRETDLSVEQAIATVTRGPARALGCGEPTLKVGRAANLVRFRLPKLGEKPRFQLLSTCVDGRWVDRGAAAESPPG